MCSPVPPAPAQMAVLHGNLYGTQILNPNYCVRMQADDMAPWREAGRRAQEGIPAPRCAYCHTTTTAATHCASCGAPR